jgi:hypothetical protein
MIKPSDIVCTGVVALFLLSACAVGTMGFEDETRQQNLYCDMVEKYKESDGMYGWPDFNSNAEEICDE